MSKKDKALLIINIFFGVLLLAGMVFTIGAAFKAGFAVDAEWYIVNSWKWAKFNILVWGIIVMVVCAAIMIISLSVSDEKHNRPTRRVRRPQQ